MCRKIQQLSSHEVYFKGQHVINIKLTESAIIAIYNVIKFCKSRICIWHFNTKLSTSFDSDLPFSAHLVGMASENNYIFWLDRRELVELHNPDICPIVEGPQHNYISEMKQQ